MKNSGKFKKQMLGPSILGVFILILGVFLSLLPTADANMYYYYQKPNEAKLRQLMTPPSFSFGAAAARAGVGRPGPIYARTKIVNGQRVCIKNNYHPKKNRLTPPGAIDTTCCLNPGETPNSNCYYPLQKYGALINKYLFQHPQI